MATKKSKIDSFLNKKDRKAEELQTEAISVEVSEAPPLQKSSMNLLGLLTFGAAKDPELAPHAYLSYLLLWTFFVGFFVLFIFPTIGNTLGFFIIALMIMLFVGAVWYFHKSETFAD